MIVPPPRIGYGLTIVLRRAIAQSFGWAMCHSSLASNSPGAGSLSDQAGDGMAGQPES
jgi:hypothetical protein